MRGIHGSIVATVLIALTATGCKKEKPEDADRDGDGVADVDDAFPDDPDEWDDTDGDGVGDNADVFPNDPDETVDTDEDGVGDNGDCAPADATLHTELVGFTDEDQDTYTVGATGTNLCTDGVLPEGFASSQSAEDDCDDGDSAVFLQLIGYLDADGDTYTIGGWTTHCTDGNLPPDFTDTASGEIDCSDSDPNNYVSCASCVDADADAWYVGCDTYVTLDGPDCGDDDENNWLSCATCADQDLDEWFGGCDAYVTLDGPDCDDTDVLTNAGAWDLPEDGIDQDCDGTDLIASNATGVFVDSGNICPGDGTMESPYCTLQLAMNDLVPGARTNVFVAGGVSGAYDGFITFDPVGVFGGYEGGFQMPGGYVQGTWDRSFGSYLGRIEPSADQVAVIDIAGASSFALEGFVVFGSSVSTGSAYTIRTDDYPDSTQVTLTKNTLGGPLASNGDSTVLRLDGGTDPVIIVGNAINGGTSVDETVGLYVLSSAVVIDNSIDGGTSTGTGPVDGTAGVDSGFTNPLVMVGNDIRGGSGARYSFGVKGTAWLTAIGNNIRGGDATEHSAGVSSAQESRIQLANNTIYGGAGDLTSTGVSSFASGLFSFPDAYVVNNIIDPGTGADSIGVHTRGPIHLLNNDIFGPTQTVLVEHYDGSAYAPIDLATTNACAWLGCEEASGNLSEDPGIVDSLDHLDPTSVCVDAGIDPSPYVQERTLLYLNRDNEGDSRPLDGDGSGSAEMDIGSDEVVP